MRVLDVTARNGVPFRVLDIAKGEEGPNVYRHHRGTDRTVEFYDRRYLSNDRVHGQFTGGSYYAETLLTSPDRRGIAGLVLDAASPGWQIDHVTYGRIIEWLREGTS
jgi:hypothetical protein